MNELPAKPEPPVCPKCGRLLADCERVSFARWAGQEWCLRCIVTFGKDAVMKTAIALLIVALAPLSLFAQTRIPAGSVLYVEPTDFGRAVAGAILKKQVPVSVTTDKTKAAYFLDTSTLAEKEGTGERVAKVLVLGGWAGSGKSRDSSVTVTNADGLIVFAYNTKKANFQSAAEGIAKHLKEHIAGKK